ncbi:MAG: hypothetical protein AB8U53_03720 [Rickettsia aeschlimannii]
MSADSIVRARINEDVKEEAAFGINLDDILLKAVRYLVADIT